MLEDHHLPCLGLMWSHCSRGYSQTTVAPMRHSAFAKRAFKSLTVSYFLFLLVPNAAQCGECGPGYASPLDAMKGECIAWDFGDQP